MCFSMTILFIFSASSWGSTDALFLTLWMWCEDGMPWWTNSANVFLQTLMIAWIISPFAHEVRAGILKNKFLVKKHSGPKMYFQTYIMGLF